MNRDALVAATIDHLSLSAQRQFSLSQINRCDTPLREQHAVKAAQ